MHLVIVEVRCAGGSHPCFAPESPCGASGAGAKLVPRTVQVPAVGGGGLRFTNSVSLRRCVDRQNGTEVPERGV
jgi:hypothetical protein